MEDGPSERSDEGVSDGTDNGSPGVSDHAPPEAAEQTTREDDPAGGFSRRELLSLTGTSVAAGLAGCPSDGGDDGTQTSGETATASGAFEVSGLTPGDTTVDRGTSYEITGEITNVGNATGTEEVTVTFDGDLVGAEMVTLDSSSSTSVTFTVETGSIAPGAYEYEMSAGTDARTATVTVEDDVFEVSDLAPADTTVTRGDAVEVSASVTNGGNVAGTADVTVSLDGSGVSTESVSLDPGSETTVSAALDTDSLDFGEHAYAISTPDDEATGTLSVTGTSFTVTDLVPADATTMRGDPVQVSATVTNAGNVAGTADVTVSLDGSGVSTESVSLDAGSETSVSAALDTDSLALGEHTHAVASPDDDEAGTLTVEDDVFEITDLDPVDATAMRGDPLQVSATVTNTGNAAGSTDIAFQLDGTTVATDPVSLDADSGTSVSAALDTDSLALGEHTHAVASPDDDETGTLTVEDDVFEITDLQPGDAEITRGDQVDISATVTNNRPTAGSAEITVRFDGETVSTETVTLDVGAETTVSVSLGTESLSHGDYTYAVVSPGDQETGTVTVGDDVFNVTGIDPADATVTRGSIIDVSATIANDGNVSGTTSVELRVDEATLDTDTVTLDPGQQTTLGFSADTASLDPGEYTHAVATPDDARSGTVVVEAADEPVEEGLVGRYDPTTVDLSDGDRVSTLEASTGEIDLTGAISAQQPTYRSGATADGSPVIQFDGDAEYLDADTALPTGSGATVAVRFRVGDHTTPRQAVVYNGSDDAGNGFGIFVNGEDENDGRVRVLYGGVTWWASDTLIQDDRFHTASLVVPNEGSDPSLYLDGESLSLSAASGGAAVEPTDQFGIGQDGSAQTEPPHFDGDVAEVVVYDRPLSASGRGVVEAYLEPDTRDGLEAYYSLDGDVPTNALTGTNATVVGDPVPGVAGVVNDGWVFSMDGSQDDTADALVSGSALPINGGEATVTGWFRYDDHEEFARIWQAGGGTGTPAQNDDGERIGWELTFDGSSDDVRLFHDESTGASLTLTPNTWYYVAAVVDGETARLHAFDHDGELDGSPATGSAPRTRTGSEPLVLLSGDDSEPSGRLDEVRAYSRALPESEVAAAYRDDLLPAEVASPETLEGYYSLDGDTVTNAVTGAEAPVQTATAGAEGFLGSARVFNADGDTDSPGDTVVTDTLPINGERATVGAWVNYSEHEQLSFVYHVDSGGDPDGPTDGWGVGFDGGNTLITRFFDDGDPATESGDSITVSPETWLFVVAVVEGGDSRLHVFDIGGELDGSPVTGGGARGLTDAASLVMMTGTGRDTAGRMDEVYAFSDALSETGVSQLYEKTRRSEVVSVPYGLDAGGTETAGPTRIDGIRFEKEPGSAVTPTASGNVNTGVTADPILGTDDDLLYQSELWGTDLGFEIGVPNGTYDVYLHFAEFTFGAPGDRVFDVSVQNEQVVNDYDIYDRVGENTADILAVRDVTVTNGTLSIESTTEVDNTKFAGIGIRRPGARELAPADGLEAYYPLDGTTPVDVITGAEATVVGSPTTGENGVVGDAFGFTMNGTASDRAGSAEDGLLDSGVELNGDAATVGAWVTFSEHEPFARVYQVGGSANDPPTDGWTVEFDEQDDAIIVNNWSGSSPTATGIRQALDADTWYYVVTVVDGDDVRLHVFDRNGERDGSPFTGSGVRTQTGAEPLVLMAGDRGDVDGRLDEVRAYSRALPVEEVLVLASVSGVDT